MPWQGLYHNLFDTMRQGVVYQDADGTIVSMNPAAEQVLGKTQAEFLGESSVTVEHDTLREDGSPFPGMEHPSMVALRTGHEVRDALMQVYNPRERQYRWISITATPLFHDGERTPYQVYTIFDDVTERRAAEARLRETQRLSEALNRINETIHASLDVDGIMQRLVSEGAAALGCDTASVSVRENGLWTIHHVHGFPPGVAGTQSQDDEERHAMLALDTRQPVAICDALHDERVDPEHMHLHKIRAVLVAPLIVRDEPFGALFFNYHDGPHPFSQAQVQFAAQLAATAAIALENGRLFDERLKSERELRKNREWLRVTLNSIGDAVIATDVRGRITFLNPVAAKLTGWQEDEAWGRPVQEVFCVVGEQGRQPAGDIVERVLSEGRVLTLTNGTVLVTKDGREVPIEDSAAPILDAAGNAAGLVLVFHDVTEQRRARQALKESEERFRSSVESLLDAFAIYSSVRDDVGRIVDFRVEYANRVACQLTGRRLEDYVGRTVLELYPDLQRTPIFDWYVEAVETGIPTIKEDFAFDEAPHRRLGVRYYDYQITRLGDGFTAAWRDVTERKCAQDALRQAHDELEQRVLERTAELQSSEERFRQLAENIHEVFWMVDLDTQQLLYVSPAYDAIWGRSRQELYQEPRSILDTIHPDDKEQVLHDLSTDWQAYDKVLRILHPDGAPRWIQVSTFPVTNERGEIYRLAGMAVDRTEQKATEAALVQAERLTTAGKLAASLAHEINNPLQSVIGCLGLAQAALDRGMDPGAYLQVAQEEVRRTAQIVGRLRSLGRPIQDERKEPTDLNTLLNDVLVLNKKHLETKKIEVIWEPDDSVPLVHVVPDSMRQVFLNLVINAADAMPEGGQLRLSAEFTERPAGVRVIVADTGTGIPPDVLPHIFDAFYSTKSQGLGVGLYVSQSIVQRHDGQIEVESPPSSPIRRAVGGQPGVGTTFTVWLPVREAALSA
jgi:PAS domain S-box-containing protein